MDIELLEKGKTRTRIIKKIDSRDWWVVVSCTPEAAGLLAGIENRYYTGTKNKDFHIAILPPMLLDPLQPIIGVAMAKKEHMNPQQLAGMLCEMGAEVTAADLRNQDILFPMDPDRHGWIVGLVCRWLYRPEMN